MGVIDDVVGRFNRVKDGEGDSFIFTIKRPDGVPIPAGEDAYAHSGLFSGWRDFTLRGIQRRANGSFVLTGGSSGTDGTINGSYNRYTGEQVGGYLYLTTALSANTCSLVLVTPPPYVESGCVVTPGVGDPMGPPIALPNNQLGGCQVVDAGDGNEVLAVGYVRLNYEDDSTGTSAILFYRISDLRLLGNLLILRMGQGNDCADAVGLTRTLAADGTAGDWLLAVANYDAKRLDFYRAPGTVFDEDAGSTDRFTACGSWSSSTKLYTTVKDTDWKAYRNVNLFTGSDGSLWLIGMHMENHGNEDWADLYSLYNPDVNGAAWGTWALGRGTPPPSGWSLTKMGKRHFTRKKQGYSDDGPRFQFGVGFSYNETTRAFEVYDCEDNLSGSDRNQIQCSRWLSGS